MMQGAAVPAALFPKRSTEEFRMIFGESGFLITILAFLVLLTPLVFIHEFGHFIVARWCGVRVEVFSIGFGRKLFGWTDSKGTQWRISAIPLGGYVRFFGDANAASAPSEAASSMSPEDRKVAFPHQAVWKRALIVAAGPAANFLFAILVFAGLFMTLGQLVTPAKVGQVMPETPAARAGFQPGDVVLAVNGGSVDSFEELQLAISQRPDETVTVTIRRGPDDRVLTVTPERLTEKDRFGNTYIHGRIGLAAQGTAIVKRGPLDALYHATIRTYDLTMAMLKGVGDIILGKRSVSELGGPVRIADMANESVTMGWISFIGFMTLISINLGLVNLFPIPMLDGGHLLLYAIEAVRRRPVSQRVQEWAFMAGFVFLMSFFALVTLNDLGNYGLWSRVTGLLG
jgi:regulator of sigma E protease